MVNEEWSMYLVVGLVPVLALVVRKCNWTSDWFLRVFGKWMDQCAIDVHIHVTADNVTVVSLDNKLCLGKPGDNVTCVSGNVLSLSEFPTLSVPGLVLCG